jgi:hypothetical protein
VRARPSGREGAAEVLRGPSPVRENVAHGGRRLQGAPRGHWALRSEPARRAAGPGGAKSLQRHGWKPRWPRTHMNGKSKLPEVQRGPDRAGGCLQVHAAGGLIIGNQTARAGRPCVTSSAARLGCARLTLHRRHGSPVTFAGRSVVRVLTVPSILMPQLMPQRIVRAGIRASTQRRTARNH